MGYDRAFRLVKNNLRNETLRERVRQSLLFGPYVVLERAATLVRLDRLELYPFKLTQRFWGKCLQRVFVDQLQGR